ncbi:MAG TPA: Spy/CpxP family protein refolding chaperone [Bryobacteraceae bacterium]|nr:Spy/CpxP family protein refolding chaperone [Bryobacteraceae bacterium]
MNKFSRLLTAAAVAATLSFAQHPGHKRGGTPPDPAAMVERRVTQLSASLSLTEDQKEKATTIFTNASTAAQSLRSTLKTTHESLADAVKTNNTAAIDQFSATLGNLTGQLAAIQGKADAAFYAVLTADQQSKFNESRRGGFRRGMANRNFRSQ